jgi:hypothetical protein
VSIEERDRQLRSVLDFALHNSSDGKAVGQIFGALATLVESDDDAEALKLAQTGILGLVGRFGTLRWRRRCGACGELFPARETFPGIFLPVPAQAPDKCSSCDAPWDGSAIRESAP